MGLTIGGLSSNNVFSKAVISGVELEQISNEILNSAPISKSAQFTEQNLPKLNFNVLNGQETGLKIFGTEASNSQVIKQVAVNRAAYDVNLSESALSAIESLKAKAANLQALDLSNKVNGKIHVPAEAPNFTDVKSIFAVNNAPQLFAADNLGKDRKGSNPFSLIKTSGKKVNKENKDGLNIFA
ncbi:MAG: hypothetical protein A2287_02085 [Candidatus Melainabacteria bacterium RIFOXYA12_FULL_32_12]|nr:MAG: hypothetical protein A2255_10605 [Candidatus Melainabacteria bacterium RIFOXYA2_FULL_32_9]OGI31535.1 MAG: hypothetical protein A2287_02085 [Candidatus Melainabacteria bacterium RIFOXYA12_FULL_32_12]